MNKIQIRTFLALKDGDKISINDDASFNASDDFINRINVYDETFRAAVMTFINDAIGIRKWAITFSQDHADEGTFVAYIWADSPEEFNEIVRIILERITFKKIKHYYKGTFASYIQNQL